MTTIALRDGILAADRACNRDGVRVGYRDKVRRIDGGRVAMMGYIPGCLAIIEWLDAGGKVDPPCIGDDEIATVIFVPDEGEPTLIELGAQSPLPEAKYHAWGDGREIALGAMWAGASAKQAVEAAISHSLTTDGGPTVLKPKHAR